jgi:S-adenosylmethionine synthetase
VGADIRIEPVADLSPDRRHVEIVERKGIGHPDTICDALTEEASRALSRFYVERFGRVLHHNVDKALLCGGHATARFGGGEVTQPIEIILAGRATSSFLGVDIPTTEIATEACRIWLRQHLRGVEPDRHVRIQCRLRPGSADLVDLFGRPGEVARANDTSIGVGFAPLSALERTVLEVERWLNSADTKRERPETGEDVKVMGTRVGATAHLTVACAFVSSHVEGASSYLEKKSSLRDAIAGVASRTGQPADVTVNAADDPARDSFYLTVTGLSAEAGDDGQVGRGNRVNGLITPGRPMTMEAAAGKNPFSHVGKLYNVMAGIIARDAEEHLAGVTSAECLLVSRIGAPVNAPQIACLRLASLEAALAPEQEQAALELVRARLADIPSLTRRLIAGELDVY